MHLVWTQAEAILLAKISVHRIWWPEYTQNLNERRKFTFTLTSISLRETHTAKTHGKICYVSFPWHIFCSLWSELVLFCLNGNVGIIFNSQLLFLQIHHNVVKSPCDQSWKRFICLFCTSSSSSSSSSSASSLSSSSSSSPSSSSSSPWPLSQAEWRWRSTRSEPEPNYNWKQGKVNLSYWWHFLLPIIIVLHCPYHHFCYRPYQHHQCLVVRQFLTLVFETKYNLGKHRLTFPFILLTIILSKAQPIIAIKIALLHKG